MYVLAAMLYMHYRYLELLTPRALRCWSCHISFSVLTKKFPPARAWEEEMGYALYIVGTG